MICSGAESAYLSFFAGSLERHKFGAACVKAAEDGMEIKL